MSIVKQLIARDGNGNIAQNAELLAYDVTFGASGVPTRGSLVSTLADANGDAIDQSTDPLQSDANGLLEFMLPAGVYWLEISRNLATTTIKRYQVGDAAERSVGVGGSELPDGAALLEALTTEEADSSDAGKVLTYVNGQGVRLRAPEPAPAFGVDELTGGLSTSWLGRMQRVTESTSVTLPTETTLSFPVGRTLTFLVEEGTLTLAPGSGATVNGGSDSWACDIEYAVVTAFKTGADSWAVQGCERVV